MRSSLRPVAGTAVPVTHRPNILLLLLGAVLIVTGTAVMLFGLISAFVAIPSGAPTLDDLGVRPDARGALEPLINGFMVFVVGCTIMTIGRYLWRGARRRGWRDRLGRFLAIIGYLMIGAAVCVFIWFGLAALEEADMDTSVAVLIQGVLVCSAILIPGTVLCMLGFRLAKEVPLMEADVSAEV